MLRGGGIRTYYPDYLNLFFSNLQDQEEKKLAREIILYIRIMPFFYYYVMYSSSRIVILNYLTTNAPKKEKGSDILLAK